MSARAEETDASATSRAAASRRAPTRSPPAMTTSPASGGAFGAVSGFVTLLATLPIFSLSLPLSFVFGVPSVWQFGEAYRPSFSYVWSKFMTEAVMGVKLKLVGNRGLYKDGECVFLSNHRAWADFFVDMYLTEGRAFILSRYLVVYAFPLFAIPAMCDGALFAFKRGKPGAHEELNAQLDAHLKTFPDYAGFVVYPEGTRNVKPRSLSLKRGLLKYTWSRKKTVQVIIAADKEQVLSEQIGKASYGVEIPVGYSDVIHSSEYENDFEGFAREVQKTWDAEWEKVYSARRDRTRALHPKAQLVTYTRGKTILLLTSVGALAAATAAFAWMFWVTVWARYLSR